MATNFAGILASLNTKLARQQAALAATQQHIAAITALQKIEEQAPPTKR